MLVRVEIVEKVRLVVVPGNAEIDAAEHFTQLVTDEVDDGAEVELGREPALDGVDDCQLGVALLEAGVARGELRRALFDLLLEALRPLRVVERDGGLVGEEPQHVAVGLVEAAVDAIHVGVEIAEELRLDDERRDDAQALPQRSCAYRRVDQVRRPGAPNVRKVRLDLTHEPFRTLAARNQRMRQFALAVEFQYKQHPFRTGELGSLFDDERVKRFSGALSVEAQPRIREALEGLAHIGLDREMREKALPRKLAFRTFLEPRRDDFAIEGDLVEIIATQTFVAQMRDRIKQEPVSPFEGVARLPGFVARGQPLRVPPPDLL